MKRYQLLLGAGLVFTTMIGCSKEPTDALVYITYRQGVDDHGTGFLIENPESDSCLVLTNAHLTGNHQDVRLTTEIDQYLHKAESVRQFPDIDLALISFKTEGGRCPYAVLEMGNAKHMKIGSAVKVMGYPEPSDNLPLIVQTYKGNLTNKEVPQAFGYGIVYNAQIAPGMSGAPVLNRQGKVIAIHGLMNGQWAM